MAFWGIEVEPGNPVTHRFHEARGRLHITRATLGVGLSEERSVVQCRIADNPPIFFCSLSLNKNESCQLDIRFEEADDVVFEVLGFQSVHLAGFYVGNSCTGNVVTEKIVEEGGDHRTCQDADVKREINKINSKAQHSTGDFEAEVEERQVIRRRTLDSGLVIEDLEMGNQHEGGIVVPGSTVQLYCFGQLTQLKSDGFIFRSNIGAKEPQSLRIPSFDDNNLRKGWKVGICGMRNGGRRRIILPPSFSSVPFGGRPSCIPTNEGLVYEFKLVAIMHL